MRIGAIFGIAVGVSACLGACTPVAERAPPTGELIAFGGGPAAAKDACFTCHGLKGEGTELAPRLAGQSHGYLLKQLEDYAGQWRDHPQMSPIARRLSGSDRVAVADYYANLQVVDEGAEVQLSGGGELYHQGDSSRQIPPCAECHGAESRGLGIPELGLLTPDYIRQQLKDWKDSRRRNDPRDVMGSIARRLTDAEIEDVSRYVSSL